MCSVVTTRHRAVSNRQDSGVVTCWERDKLIFVFCLFKELLARQKKTEYCRRSTCSSKCSNRAFSFLISVFLHNNILAKQSEEFQLRPLTHMVCGIEECKGPFSCVPFSPRRGLRGFTGKQKWQTSKCCLRVSLSRWALTMFAVGEMTACLMRVFSG